MPLTQLLVATSNPGNIREFRVMLSESNPELLFLSDLDQSFGEPDETGISFAENAQLKARYYAQLSQLPTIADDSGLCVLGLDGFPGINSARWSPGSNEDRVTALLNLLSERGLTDPEQRRAYFACTISLVFPDQEKSLEFEGACWGTLTHLPIGSGGFGYDSIFVADGQTQTMAQLSLDEKNAISARSVAMKKLVSWLEQH